ncbi:hypothetical protein HDU67_003537 [Dinochytrium kinnereticum]|nr:hypothetical protein HDU67_003537 [Dinochytrium kinnereticum]
MPRRFQLSSTTFSNLYRRVSATVVGGLKTVANAAIKKIDPEAYSSAYVSSFDGGLGGLDEEGYASDKNDASFATPMLNRDFLQTAAYLLSEKMIQRFRSRWGEPRRCDFQSGPSLASAFAPNSSEYVLDGITLKVVAPNRAALDNVTGSLRFVLVGVHFDDFL